MSRHHSFFAVALLLLTVHRQCVVTAGETDPRQQHLDTINEYFSRGVAPSDNGVVLVHAAFGPHPENATLPKEYFDRLGIPSPPETGDYFDNMVCPAKDAPAFSEQLERAMQAPWTRDEYPLILDWLQSESQPVSRMIDAIHRPEWFTPLEPGYDDDGNRASLFMTLLPATQQYRSVARFLICRAMLRTGERDYEGAWQDLSHCHRLSRMVARGSTLIDFLVGLAINNMATDATVTFVERTGPGAEFLARMRGDLAAQPPMPDPTPALNYTERLMAEDAVDMLERRDYRILEVTGAEFPPSTLLRLALLPVDWNQVRHQLSQSYTEIVHATQITDARRRARTLQDLESRAAVHSTLTARHILQRVLESPTLTTAWSSLVTDQLRSLLMPAAVGIDSARSRCDARLKMAQLFLAVEQYRQETGHYPESLHQVAATGIELSIADPFSSSPFRYRVRDNGFVLYSVGRNRRDDGGLANSDGDGSDDVCIALSRNAD